MFNRNAPIGIGSSFRNKPLLASAKATYTNVFYHGDNLEQANGTLSDFDSLTDNFARKNFLVRLPRVVRFFASRQAIFDSYYSSLFASLAATYAPEGICFAWGRYTPVFNHRFLRDCTPGLGALSVADIYAGDVLVFVLADRNLSYAFQDPLSSPNANYEADYDMFVAAHPRHLSFRGYYYNIFFDGSVPDPGPHDDDEVIADAMAGTGSFAALGPGLNDFGWTLINQAWDINLITEAHFAARIEAFFNL